MFGGIVPWWSLVLLGVYFAITLFGGGALLFVGTRFIVKTPRAAYWRSVLAMVLGVLGSTVITGIVSAPVSENRALFFLPVIGLVLSLLWTWFIIGRIFKISLGKSALAWLPVLGFQILIGIPLMVSILLPSLHNARALAQAAASYSNLHGIGLGMMLYASGNEDNFPPSFEELIASGEVCEKMLHYPGTSVDKPRSYFYLAPKSKNEDVDGNTIIACEKKNFNRVKKGRSVLFASCEVKFLSPEQFAAELAKPQNAAFAAALKQADGP